MKSDFYRDLGVRDSRLFVELLYVLYTHKLILILGAKGFEIGGEVVVQTTDKGIDVLKWYER